MLRTHTCGELSKENDGGQVTLSGWAQTVRDHGGVIFIDLRDRYGLTQVVCEPEHNAAVHALAETVGREFVIRVTGTVRRRPDSMVNPNLSTGEVEVLADDLAVLNKSATPPFEIEESLAVHEELRLKYRYLDLRRPNVFRTMKLRSDVVARTRRYFEEQGFMEVETPMLIRSTPEGARDFLVPSRIYPGSAFALPQSPQLFKQILMVGGIDRFYQIARCMRDEDSRADRQLEFTQLDFEMSFVEEEDIYGITEGWLQAVFRDTLGVEITAPFKRLSYEEAMRDYGCDKPDLRFDMKLVDVSAVVKDAGFSVFQSVIGKGGMVKAMCIKSPGFSRKDIDDLIAQAQGLGAKGMAYMKMGDKLESSITKFFSAEELNELAALVKAENGDLVVFIADMPTTTNRVMSELRLIVARRLGLIKPDQFSFCWINRFPLFEYDAETKRWAPMHHIFTMPRPEDTEKLTDDPGAVHGQLYDLVLNGVELCSGSIRIHDPELQKRVLQVIGMSEEEAQSKFGFLLNSFTYGAPPHGGLAPGIDRLIMLMIGEDNIREVIAFPKTQRGQCLMTDAPTEVDADQWRELGLTPVP